MLSYSPMDNVRPQPYPHVLILVGLHDPRVAYWEPTKWAQKLRSAQQQAVEWSKAALEDLEEGEGADKSDEVEIEVEQGDILLKVREKVWYRSACRFWPKFGSFLIKNMFKTGFFGEQKWLYLIKSDQNTFLKPKITRFHCVFDQK